MTTTSWTGWVPDGDLVRELEGQFARTLASYRAHPDLVSEHANHEESIRTGGYANRTLRELVQNAADALAGSVGESGTAAGRVEIVLDETNRVLYCANGGRPFSRSGLTAVTMAHLSGKRGDEIGRFGLGFKSVLAVSSAPQVLSRSVAFEFNALRSREAMESVTSVKHYPVLRTATPLNAKKEFEADAVLAELASWATTIVKLPNATNLDRLREEVETFSSEFLLFVGAVREIRLRVIGDNPFATSHLSRDLGDGRFRIERSDGDGDEWLVESRMHAPSLEARRQVGEAVSRHEVKVSVALPAVRSRLRIGQFWSYFPLQDTTSASALFNAPWSVNDDRTNLLSNQYNREILQTMATIFAQVLARVQSAEDPAAHLDYLPARDRGQESHGFAGDVLGAHILHSAGAGAFIPDAANVLRNGSDLRPLDLEVRFDALVHQGWCMSPNTGDDVPHWRCYSTPTRMRRLRDLLLAAQESELEPSQRDQRLALERMPRRGVLSWLREWAEGTDARSAANAFRTVAGPPVQDGLEKAKVIPTTGGMRSLDDRNVVFLHQEADLEIEGAVFIDPAFLAEPDIERRLRAQGFRDLGPETILSARLAMLPNSPSAEDLEILWDAALSVSIPQATAAMVASTASIKVPTRDGGWSWPQQVLNIDAQLPARFASRLLDKDRCMPDVAHALGVVRSPVRDFALEDEPARETYRAEIVGGLNAQRGPGERSVERAELSQEKGPGPFSALLMLQEAEAPLAVRVDWTVKLLELPDAEWQCEDLDSGRTYSVPSPVQWAVGKAGLLGSTRGFRAPQDVVAPSLIKFGAFLPLARISHQLQAVLGLPDELTDVPPHILREALEAELFGSVDDEVLAEFVLAATKLSFGGTMPSSIPARVMRTLEAHRPSSVYLATDDEQEEFLHSRHRPFLRVPAEFTEEFVRVVGCRRFEDSFSFAMIIDGQSDAQPILDVYTGLRPAHGRKLGSARVARALQLAKRVTTEDGVEDQPLSWHLDGFDLIVRDGADETRVLEYVNEAFDLRLDNAQLASVRKAGLNHRLELQRQKARSIDDDAERLDHYIGPDTLRDALPIGLWGALEAQGLVGDSTSVAELFLTVYRSEALSILADAFREEGFEDVPSRWAGSQPAISWVRKMGFGSEFAGIRNQQRPEEFVVAGAVRLNRLHPYQKRISESLRTLLTQPSDLGPGRKGMVELPTGAGKTRVATETVLKLFIDDVRTGTILWIAQSAELCEQAVQTFQSVWRWLGDERPLTIGRLWDTNAVNEPDTEFSVVVATDAKIEAVMGRSEYEWLRTPVAVFIDEAHRAGGSKRYTEILRWLGVGGRSWERPLVGLSATPFKGRQGDEGGTSDLVARFGRKLITDFEDNAYQQLVQLGVLARVKHEVLPSGLDVDLKSTEQSALHESRLIDRGLYEKIGRNEERMRVLVDHILKQDPDWPILVFTPSVLSAQVLAASLRYQNRTAASVSGQTGRQERRDTIKQFQQGELQILANCDLLVQGFDAPGVRALYIARPTFSPSAYIQMAGRGLRGPKNGGKEECLIVDVADNWGAMNDFLGYRDYENLWMEHRE